MQGGDRPGGDAPPLVGEDEMREMVREVMAEPQLGAPSRDVTAIKGQVQQLRSEFASIRADFVSMLSRPSRSQRTGSRTEPPRAPPAVDARPVYALAFLTPPPTELLFGKPVPLLSVGLADGAALAGLPATKVVCSMCQPGSDEDVAQILFGETEVIMRGGVAEFSGLSLGRLAWLKRGGIYRLKVSAHDPSCPYRLAPLLTAAIDVRNKPSSRAAKAAAAAAASPSPLAFLRCGAAPLPPPPQLPHPLQLQLPLTPALPPPLQPQPYACPMGCGSEPARFLGLPVHAAVALKRKPNSSCAAEHAPPSPDLGAGAGDGGAYGGGFGGQTVPTFALPPPPAAPSWMERMRPSLKKTQPRAGEPGGSAALPGAEPMAVLTGGMDRVTVSREGLGGAADAGAYEPRRGHAGEPDSLSPLRARAGARSKSPPLPPLGERANSGSTLSALQRLGSSGIFELAHAVFGHDSMARSGLESEHGGSPLKAAASAPSPPSPPRARGDL